jgi:effector-binding domain-containing protein
MKKIVIILFMVSLILSLHSQGTVEIKEGTNFSYVCMEFKGSHSQITENIPALFLEIRKQSLETKIVGDVLGVFFDSSLLEEEKSDFYVLGFRMDQNSLVASPLEVRTYEFDRTAEITHLGPYETVASSFSIILSYIEENGLEIAGPPAEIWMGDPSQDKPEDLKTRIIIPVRIIENPK